MLQRVSTVQRNITAQVSVFYFIYLKREKKKEKDRKILKIFEIVIRSRLIYTYVVNFNGGFFSLSLKFTHVRSEYKNIEGKRE